MAILTPLWTVDALTDDAAITEFLNARGITFERWALPERAAELAAQPSLTDEQKIELVHLFKDKLAEKSESDGYSTFDVVVIRPHFPGVDDALAKFDKVHYHDDDEVRAIVGGTGIFGFVQDDGRQFTVTLSGGEFISLPAGMWHWFYCLSDKNTTAIRLFKDDPKWTPHYRDNARPFGLVSDHE